jgi:hypothetical protein
MEPSIGHNKKCPFCREKQSSFIKGAEAIKSAFRIAEEKYEDYKIVDGVKLENLIFASIFGQTDLIKLAAEEIIEEENQSDEEQPEALQPETPAKVLPQQPGEIEQPQIAPQPQPQITPTETEAPPQTGVSVEQQPELQNEDKFIDSTADILVKEISNALKEDNFNLDSKEAISEILPQLLKASVSYEKTIVAQSATAPKGKDTLTGIGEGSGIGHLIGVAKAEQAFELGDAFGKSAVLTPQERAATNAIFSRYRSIMEDVPYNVPGAELENQRRMLLRQKMKDEMLAVVKVPEKMKAYFTSIGVRDNFLDALSGTAKQTSNLVPTQTLLQAFRSPGLDVTREYDFYKKNKSRYAPNDQFWIDSALRARGL